MTTDEEEDEDEEAEEEDDEEEEEDAEKGSKEKFLVFVQSRLSAILSSNKFFLHCLFSHFPLFFLILFFFQIFFSTPASQAISGSLILTIWNKSKTCVG